MVFSHYKKILESRLQTIQRKKSYNFLGGSKEVGLLKEDTASLGLKANGNIPAINFAVPSLTILQ